MRKSIIFLLVIAALFLIAGPGLAGVKIPGRTNYLVNDHANALSPETKSYIEKLLRKIRGNDFTGTEIVVSTFKSSEGMPSDKFALEYAKKWRRPALLENDNRIHIIIIIDEKKVRIGIGRYLDHIITPEVSQFIINHIIYPEFSRGNHDAAVKRGVETIIDMLDKGRLPKSYTFFYATLIFKSIVLLLIALIVFFALRRKY